MHTRAVHMSMCECTWELHTFECVNAHESLHMCMCVMNAHESLHMHAHQSFTHLNVWMHTRAYAWVCVSWMYVCHECTLEHITPVNAHESLHVWMSTWRIQQNLFKCNFWHGSLQIDILTCIRTRAYTWACVMNTHEHVCHEYTQEYTHMNEHVCHEYTWACVSWIHTRVYTYEWACVSWIHTRVYTYEWACVSWIHTRVYTYECKSIHIWIHTRVYTHECTRALTHMAVSMVE